VRPGIMETLENQSEASVIILENDRQIAEFLAEVA
jgi:hypothetical protein